MIENISHTHLRRIIDSSFTNDENLFDNPLFMVELNYSLFIVPTFKVNDKTAFYILNQKIIPVFTDLDEYNKMFRDNEKITPEIQDFDYIISAKADLVINPVSENIIDVNLFRDKADTPYFEYNSIYRGYNCSELKIIAQKSKNKELKEMIKNPRIIYDYEVFFPQLRKSTLLTLVYSQDNHEDIIDFTNGITAIEEVNKGFFEFYTSMDEVNKTQNSYVQVINIAEFMELIIRFDFEGMIINPNSDNLVITRDIILLNFENFRDEYDYSRYMQSHNFAFKVK